MSLFGTAEENFSSAEKKVVPVDWLYFDTDSGRVCVVHDGSDLVSPKWFYFRAKNLSKKSSEVLENRVIGSGE